MKNLIYALVTALVFLGVFLSCSNGRNSAPVEESDTIVVDESSYTTEEDSVSIDYDVDSDYDVSSDYGIDQTDVPDFSGDWESTNHKFRLSLSLSQHDGEVEVIVCQIYRTYAWESNARIEDGKLILDDPDSDFSFHAEFVLRDGKLTGQCRAKGSPNDPNFSGNLTLKPEDKDNAQYKL